jgi:RNA polymerase sigma-70 factor, ECF subfamily
MSEKRDGELISRKQSAEITLQIMRYRSMIFGYILAQTADYNGAEDVFQDVCMTICEKYPEFKQGTNFKAWAMEITRFKLMTYYHGQKRGMMQLTEDIAEDLGEHPAWLEGEKPFAEEQAALRKCLAKLTEKNRSLVVKRYGEGLAPRAIAEFLHWTAESVYVALSRLRVTLEKCIKEQMSTGGRT